VDASKSTSAQIILDLVLPFQIAPTLQVDIFVELAPVGTKETPMSVATSTAKMHALMEVNAVVPTLAIALEPDTKEPHVTLMWMNVH